ncbi:MAG: hypothetical protein ACTSQZ_07770, partial [Candidatus Thorarchaeota archaeon]
MNLKAIRGRNQRGLSYVSEISETVSHPIVKITINGRDVFSKLRVHDSVEVGSVVLDYRLFDELGCDTSSQVEITPIEENIPLCTDIHFSVNSTRAVDVQKVIKAISDRIDEFKEHFDGLILKKGQVIHIEPLNLHFTVKDMTPCTTGSGISQISWDHVLKINLEPAVESTTERLCYNLCSLMDLGAASHISDVFDNADLEQSDIGSLPRYRASTRILSKLISNLLSCNESTPLFTSIVYSEEHEVFSTYDPINGYPTLITEIQTASLQEVHEEWISEKLTDYSKKASNPSLAFKIGISSSVRLDEINDLPPILLFMSSGTYSQGSNPIKTIQSQIENVKKMILVCVGLGTKQDESLLQ